MHNCFCGFWAATLGAGTALLVGCSAEGENPSDSVIAATGLPLSVYDRESPLDIQIEMSEADWDRLRADGRSMAAIVNPTETGFEYQRFPSQVTVAGNVFANVEIRKKGFIGSLSTLRPSLKFDFGPQVAIDQSGTRRLALNNDQQDPSHVRQCLSFDLFAQAGIPAPRCAYARVTVNGQDLGVYTSVEPIRKRMLERFFDDTSGHLYEGTLADFTEDSVDRMEAKRPEPDANRMDLANVVAALAAPDAQVVEQLSALVDLDSFRTFWALETMLGHWDGYSGNANNYYLYADPTSGKFVFMPWGTDQIFVGRPDFNEDPYEPTGYAHGALARRLYDLPEQRQAFRQRLQDLTEELWQPDVLLASVNELLAVASNANSSAVEELKDHVRTHGDELLNSLEVSLPEVPLREETETDACGNTVSEIEGSFAMSFSLTGAGGDYFDFQTTIDTDEVQAELLGITVVDNADPDRAIILGLGEIANRTVTIGFILPRVFFAPGVQPFHSFESFGFLNVFDPESGEEEGVGVIGDGQLLFTEGGATEGSPIEATFRAKLFQSQCANW